MSNISNIPAVKYIYIFLFYPQLFGVLLLALISKWKDHFCIGQTKEFKLKRGTHTFFYFILTSDFYCPPLFIFSFIISFIIYQHCNEQCNEVPNSCYLTVVLTEVLKIWFFSFLFITFSINHLKQNLLLGRKLAPAHSPFPPNSYQWRFPLYIFFLL